MKLTIQIKILPNPEQSQSLLATMRAMNAASNYAAKVGFENKVFGQFSIHKLCYKEIREIFYLPSQLAIRSISKASTAFKINKKKIPEFTPLGAVECDNRVYRIVNSNTVSINTINGRIQLPYVFGNYFKDGLHGKLGQADLVYKNDKFYLYISTEFTEEPPIETKEYLGVDLGIVNIATTSDGETFSGEQVEKIRRRNYVARKQYQRRGTKSAKRRLKSMSGRQKRFQVITNHTISKRIVAKAKALGQGISMENLTGIRNRIEKTVGKRMRRRIGNWGFYQLKHFIKYKSQMQGIPVVEVNPRNTSRTCSSCGFCSIDNRKTQKKFKCLSCGMSMNADLNAAENISQLGASYKLPSKVSVKALAN